MARGHDSLTWEVKSCQIASDGISWYPVSFGVNIWIIYEMICEMWMLCESLHTRCRLQPLVGMVGSLLLHPCNQPRQRLTAWPHRHVESNFEEQLAIEAY